MVEAVGEKSFSLKMKRKWPCENDKYLMAAKLGNAVVPVIVRGMTDSRASVGIAKRDIRSSRITGERSVNSMPIFDFICGDCGEQFEALVRGRRGISAAARARVRVSAVVRKSGYRTHVGKDRVHCPAIQVAVHPAGVRGVEVRSPDGDFLLALRGRGEKQGGEAGGRRGGGW